MITRGKLSYNPITGHFVWAEKPSGPVCVGARAGSVCTDGYRHICIDGRKVKAHRLAWLFVHGVEPSSALDHINGRRDDNRISNLRLATRGENNRNAAKRKDNTSGFKGVSFDRKTQKFWAQIQVDGVRKSLGYFTTAEEASAAYKGAATVLHGAFAKMFGST